MVFITPVIASTIKFVSPLPGRSVASLQTLNYLKTGLLWGQRLHLPLILPKLTEVPESSWQKCIRIGCTGLNHHRQNMQTYIHSGFGKVCCPCSRSESRYSVLGQGHPERCINKVLPSMERWEHTCRRGSMLLQYLISCDIFWLVYFYQFLLLFTGCFIL